MTARSLVHALFLMLWTIGSTYDSVLPDPVGAEMQTSPGCCEIRGRRSGKIPACTARALGYSFSDGRCSLSTPKSSKTAVASAGMVTGFDSHGGSTENMGISGGSGAGSG